MRLAVSGTYSSGKTTTSLALAYLTGIPRTHAKTMREILPEVLPGRRLEDCTVPELFQLGIIRYTERALHESLLPSGFISDGSSLHEWVYGKIRVRVGIHPGRPTAAAAFAPVSESRLFEQVIDAMGAVMQRHARKSYDAFAHLPIEFPLVADGHRPVSEEFRALSDELLLTTLKELDIPVQVIGGTLPERLQRIVRTFELPTVMPVARAVEAAYADLAARDNADETARAVRAGSPATKL